MGAARAAAGREGGEKKTTHDGSQNLIVWLHLKPLGQGGYK